MSFTEQNYDSLTSPPEAPAEPDDGIRSFADWASGTGPVWGEHSSQILNSHEKAIVEPIDVGSVACNAKIISFEPIDSRRFGS